jgi:DNA-binding transcriptional regulator LsrR (DeoR family)
MKVISDITKLLKGHEMLAEEISEKLKMPERKIVNYLDKMAIAGKIKTGITDDVPYTKTYTI